MFSLIMSLYSIYWVSEHRNEIIIGAVALIVAITYFVRRNKRRRAEYVALPVRFIGNKTSKTYHTASCPYTAQILPENRIAFRLEGETAQLGYRPCGSCRPRWN